MGSEKLSRWVAVGFLALLLNSGYIWAFASPTIFYMGNVLLGVAVAAGAVVLLGGRWRHAWRKPATWAFLAALGLGLFLTFAGAPRANRVALWGPIGAALVGVAQAAHEEALFRRFKADEAAQAITGRPRMLSPDDSNERQLIHEHDSVPLQEVSR